MIIDQWSMINDQSTMINDQWSLIVDRGQGTRDKGQGQGTGTRDRDQGQGQGTEIGEMSQNGQSRLKINFSYFSDAGFAEFDLRIAQNYVHMLHRPIHNWEWSMSWNGWTLPSFTIVWPSKLQSSIDHLSSNLYHMSYITCHASNMLHHVIWHHLLLKYRHVSSHTYIYIYIYIYICTFYKYNEESRILEAAKVLLSLRIWQKVNFSSRAA